MSSKAEIGQLQPGIELPTQDWRNFNSLLPVILTLIGATLLVLFRYQGSTLNVLREGSLTNLAFIFYIASSLLFGMYLIGREPLMGRIAIWLMGFGFMCNLAAWGVRWIEYVEHTKLQGDMPKIWPTMPWTEKVNHTFPLSNLYDITLGLTCFLGFTSVLVGTRKKYEFLGAVTMPLGALFLILAIFLGNDISTLQPILRSYWRPIHVGVAALSYGVIVVTFAIAILYLLKDKMPVERVALVVALFAVSIYLLVAGMFGNFSLISGSFGMNVVMENMNGAFTPIRFTEARGDFMTAEFPYVGRMIQVVVVTFFIAILLYLKDMFMGEDASLRKIANKLFIVGFVFQVLAVGTMYYQMNSIKDLGNYVPDSQIPKLAGQMGHDHDHNDGDNHNHAATTPTAEQVRARLQELSPKMRVSFGSNPVVSAGFFAVIVGGLFFLLFKLRGDKILSNLPSLDVLDSLNYKMVSVCFPGLTLMLILGAVWANESWGTYWSWDPKETWGFITWVAYAGFLHTRITHGWKGRRSAYFAILGFLFMLFTYLGVSYLLPGLHSYA
ncbi:MAG: cytochrome c biogenesis protein CcsA [Acidobacteriota bacterium]